MTEFNIRHKISNMIDKGATDRAIYVELNSRLTPMQQMLSVAQMLPTMIADTRQSLDELRGKPSPLDELRVMVDELGLNAPAEALDMLGYLTERRQRIDQARADQVAVEDQVLTLIERLEQRHRSNEARLTEMEATSRT